jgi:polysaccharide export outer membrane protein
MKIAIHLLRLGISISLLVFVLSSCGAYKQNVLFRTGDTFDNQAFQSSLAKAEQNYTIRKFDYLRINVYTNDGAVIFDPIKAFPFQGVQNQNQGQNAQQTLQLTQIQGNKYNDAYMIDENGDAFLPRIGKIHLEGLKLYEADTLLSNEFKSDFQNPYVKTRFANKRVVVMGALGNKIIPLEESNMNLLEVLARSGSLTSNVRANEIRLIRGVGTDSITMQKIDLTTWDGLNVAELIIRPNDVIYVTPRRRVAKEFLVDVSTIIQTIVGSVTVLLTTILLINNTK